MRDWTAGITTVDALKAAVACQFQHNTPHSHQLLLAQQAHNAPSAAVAIKSHRAAFYAQFERIVCAGLVRQHAALHLNIPEDLLEGFCVDVRMLDKFKLFTLGFEQMQMERWGGGIKGLDLHEEPIYWQKFHLIVEYRFLYDNT